MPLPIGELEWQILHVLIRKKKIMTVGELARHLKTKSDKISDAVDKLIDVRFVRQADDTIGIFAVAGPEFIGRRMIRYLITGE